MAASTAIRDDRLHFHRLGVRQILCRDRLIHQFLGQREAVGFERLLPRGRVRPNPRPQGLSLTVALLEQFRFPSDPLTVARAILLEEGRGHRSLPVEEVSFIRHHRAHDQLLELAHIGRHRTLNHFEDRWDRDFPLVGFPPLVVERRLNDLEPDETQPRRSAEKEQQHGELPAHAVHVQQAEDDLERQPHTDDRPGRHDGISEVDPVVRYQGEPPAGDIGDLRDENHRREYAADDAPIRSEGERQTGHGEEYGERQQVRMRRLRQPFDIGLLRGPHPFAVDDLLARRRDPRFQFVVIRQRRSLVRVAILAARLD